MSPCFSWCWLLNDEKMQKGTTPETGFVLETLDNEPPPGTRRLGASLGGHPDEDMHGHAP